MVRPFCLQPQHSGCPVSLCGRRLPGVRQRTHTHRRLTQGRLHTLSRGHSELRIRPHVLSDPTRQEARHERSRSDLAGRWEGSIMPPH